MTRVSPDRDPPAPASARKDARRDFLREHGPALAVVAVLAVGLAVTVVVLTGGESRPAPKRIAEVTIVNIQPPPPPPPPPPQHDQPKMVEQPKMIEPEFKPEQPRPKDEPPPKAADDQPPPGPLGLDQAADGPGDDFNLAGRPGGGGLLGSGGGGGSRWGWYATMVQAQVEEALRANRRTRSAKTRVEIRLWADADGRVTRVQMAASTGDSDVDYAIKTEILANLQLKEPPPKDMPMPIVARLTARRPG
jgi:outer membrane biosynthesis protein TonB